MTEEEEAAMIAQAIAASLSVQPSASEETRPENALPAPVAAVPPPLPLTSAVPPASTPQQQAIAASLPRVRSHAYSDALGPLMLGTGKEAV